jgi:hypothetical protein
MLIDDVRGVVLNFRTSQELDSFFIDPTGATVEMAQERCVLVRGNALSFGFFSMLRDLFKVEAQVLSFFSIDNSSPFCLFVCLLSTQQNDY